MSRILTDHIVNGLNEALKIAVLDEPGQGGACHEYSITIIPPERTPIDDGMIRGGCSVRFQNGPIKEYGVNGISQEALLAILIDRLRGFQAGQFACRDNDKALGHLEEALGWLQKRTRERMQRGVEGTNKA